MCRLTRHRPADVLGFEYLAQDLIAWCLRRGGIARDGVQQAPAPQAADHVDQAAKTTGRWLRLRLEAAKDGGKQGARRGPGRSGVEADLPCNRVQRARLLQQFCDVQCGFLSGYRRHGEHILDAADGFIVAFIT